MASGLTSRPVQTVKIGPDGRPIVSDGTQAVVDAFGRTNNYQTGELPFRSLNGAGPIQGSKVNRGQWSEFMQPQNWPTDQTMPMNHPPTATAAISPDAQLNSPPLAAYDETPTSPGEKAIVEAIISGGHQMQGPPPPPEGWQPMQWDDAVPGGPATGGDPWANDRVNGATLNGTAPRTGLVTGAAPSKAVALHQRLMASPEKFAANRARADAALAIDMAGGSTPRVQQGTQQYYGLNDKQWTKYVGLMRGGDQKAAHAFLNRTRK